MTAIGFVLSLGILFAIYFGLVGYSTEAQAQHGKGIVIAGMVFGAIWLVVLMLSSFGSHCQLRKVLLGKRSVSGAYILSTKSKQEETR
jgi:hypothetical protein